MNRTTWLEGFSETIQEDMQFAVRVYAVQKMVKNKS
jgi:hypothetical protein